MKKEFFPYYISRAILSLVFALLVLGITWNAVFLGAIFFGLFLLYLHSGWFQIDMKYPLVPLRRDPRGQDIQRKALLVSVMAGVLVHVTAPYLMGSFGLFPVGNMALTTGIIAYFATQFVLFVRA